VEKVESGEGEVGDEAARQVVETQLMRAGIRLSVLLNKAFQ
jgi:hypothetical protein